MRQAKGGSAAAHPFENEKSDLLESGQLTPPTPPSIRTVTPKITIDKVPRPCYPSTDVRSSTSASRPGPRTSSSVVPPVSHGSQDFNDVLHFTIEHPAKDASPERAAFGRAEGPLCRFTHPAKDVRSLHPEYRRGASPERVRERESNGPLRLFSASATPYVLSNIQKSAHLIENKYF